MQEHELIRVYETKLLREWDHTAMISANLHTIMDILIQTNSKKARPVNYKTPEEMHPFREDKQKTHIQSISQLKPLVPHMRQAIHANKSPAGHH